MRLVLDTNVVVAALLWCGPPRRLLELAMDDAVSLVSSPALLTELLNTLQYPKFDKRLATFGATAQALVVQYSALVRVVEPQHVLRVIADDPDDDQVLACATAAKAHIIVSGDKHLHSLGGKYQGVRIVTPAEAVRIFVAA
jgi:putative PIN family toxin of toxin-antitoxin system